MQLRAERVGFRSGDGAGEVGISEQQSRMARAKAGKNIVGGAEVGQDKQS
ncbi:MAG: hypothetical protein K8R87_01255 [Verrucomicrobia bacterium]|nr:hypothetical protein [Verrucomicrobiota bacterium]